MARPLGSPNKRKKLKSFRCTRCAEVFDDATNKFYTSNTSEIFSGNEHKACICIKCAEFLFEEIEKKYENRKLALLTLCHYLDIYFSESQYEKMKSNPNFSLGIYIRSLNARRGSGQPKTFLNSIQELLESGFRNANEVRDEIETKWKQADRKNKLYCITNVGYDCFADESYTDENRRYLFNTLSDYLTDDVLEDPHKLQSVIVMVKTMLQIEAINKILNVELKKNNFDCAKIDKLSSVKDKLTRNLNSTANENGISAKGSGKSSKGSNTLTHIMKEMHDTGFEEIKVNYIDAKMSKSYEEIANINARALMQELNLTADDYALMVSKQSENIRKLQTENERIQEQNRKTKIELKTLQEQLEKVGAKK